MVKTKQDGRGIVQVSKLTARIMNGQEDLSTWSEEELERGSRRGSDGKFRRPPTVVAKAVHDELVRRRMSAAYDLLRTNTYDAVEVLISIAKDTDADAAIRVKAAELILDRTLGKAPQTISLDVRSDGDPWQQLVQAAVLPSVADALALMTAQEADSAIVEGEVVEEVSG